MRKVLLLIAVLMSTAVLAYAYAELTVDPHTQKVKIGDVGNYTLTLNTNMTGDQKLTWDTGTPVILARLNETGSYTQTGSLDFTSTGKDGQKFKLQIKPGDGAVVGQEYDITISFGPNAEHIKAVVTASIVPVPELSTGILMSAGLIGLVGLVRMRRKET